MPLHLDELWWNDPEHLVAGLLGVVSASLAADPVQWHRIDTTTGDVSVLGAAGPTLPTPDGSLPAHEPDHECATVAKAGTLCSPHVVGASTTLSDGTIGVLVARRQHGVAYTAHDLALVRSAALRLAGQQVDDTDDSGDGAHGSLRRLFAAPDERLGLKEILYGAGPPAAVTAMLSSLTDSSSYGPSALLLLSCVVAAVMAGMRSAILSAVVGTVALWWAFTPELRSWTVATWPDALGLVVFLAAAIGVALLVMRLEEVRAHEHVERQLADVLLDQSPEATAVFDRDLRFRRVNEPMARMNGVAVADHIGKRPTELSPIAGQLYEHLLARVRDGGDPVAAWPLDISIPALSLERHWVLSLRPLRDPDANVVGIGAAFTDVTAETVAHRQAAQTLHLAEALSEAADKQQIADSVCAHLTEAFDGHAAVVLWGDPTGEVRALRGVSDDETRAWFEAHGTAAGALPNAGDTTAVSYPLRSTGTPNGGIQVVWDEPRTVTPTMLTLLGTVSSLTALALDRVSATEKAHQDQFRRALDSMLDEVTIGRAIRGPSGVIEDFVIEFINGATGSVDSGRAVGRRLCDVHPNWRRTGTFDRFCEVVETGRPYQVERLPDLATAPDGGIVEQFRTLQVAQLGDGYIAAMRDITDIVAAEAAQHAAALLAANERSAIDLLQAAAIPRALPQPPGVRMAAMYEPADRSEPIGGDWYDAFELADGRLALVIADVAGHGRHAAVFMVQVRNVFRALADEYAEPGDVLTRANDVTSRLNDPGGPFVTCCYAVLDLPSRTLTWAQAGHFSPLIVHPDDTSSYLPEHPGPPLALTAGRRYASSFVVLRPGDRILLFTDGLVERRREHLDVGLARLAREACAHSDLDPNDLVRALSASVTDRFDDLALLCLELVVQETV
ncbi:MAG: SpoIIE family protein phosphatase [Actinomycetota bacterium]|nr:SpoIIE family protein phosphatase [Actinomycetota bacterium]